MTGGHINNLKVYKYGDEYDVFSTDIYSIHNYVNFSVERTIEAPSDNYKRNFQYVFRDGNWTEFPKPDGVYDDFIAAAPYKPAEINIGGLEEQLKRNHATKICG